MLFPSDEEIEGYGLENGQNPKSLGAHGLEQIKSSMITEYGRGVSGYGDFGRYVFGKAIRHWPEVDENLLSNLAVKLIIEKYGYNPSTHGVFDSEEVGWHSREVNKQERIGKKYQWIAFYEILAKLSDHFKFSRDSYRQSKDGISFEGPWNPFVRNIDPTLLVPQIKDEESISFWFDKPLLKDWSGTPEVWVNSKESLPIPTSLIEFVDEKSQSWLALEMLPNWEENKSNKLEQNKEIWAQVRSYLIREEDYHKIARWAEKQNFMGRWMPESNSRHELFNREFYWAPANKTFSIDYFGGQTWNSVIDPKTGITIGEVSPTVVNYNWESQYDVTSK